MGYGALYYIDQRTGEKTEIAEGGICDVCICDGMEYTETIIPCNRKTTFECEVKVDRLGLLSLIYGRKITNNWLKMHGGIMTRRAKA